MSRRRKSSRPPARPPRSRARLVAIVVGIALVAIVAWWLRGREPGPPVVSDATRALLPRLQEMLADGRLDEGVAAGEEHLEAEPGAAGVHYMLGLFAEARDDAEAAARHFEAEVERSPGHVDSQIHLAGALLRLGRDDDARRRLETANRLAPDNLEVAFALGRVLAQSGETGDARRELERALPAYPVEAAFELGLLARRDDDLGAAEAWFRRALGADPDHLGSVFNLGQTLILTGRQTDGERFLVRHAELQKQQDQLEVLIKATRFEWSEPDNFVDLGEYQLVRGDAEGAERSFGQALQRDPDHAAALTGLGRSLLERSRPAEATRPLRRAAELAPDDGRVAFFLGIALHESGEFESAREVLGRSRQLGEWSAGEYLFLGNAFTRTGALADAELAYRRALELEPELPDAHYKLSILLYERSDLEGAERHLATYEQLEPKNGVARVLHGVVLYRLGREDDARSAFESGLNRLRVTSPTSGDLDRALAGFDSLDEAGPALQLLRRLRGSDPEPES